MPFPNFKNKQDEAPLFTPKEYVEYAKTRGHYDFKAPTSIIFCYQSSLVNYICENHETNHVSGLMLYK